MKTRSKELLPFILLFLIFNNFFLFGKSLLARFGMDHLVMIIANSLFFVISVIAYFMQKKALRHSNPNVFVRSVMGGMMLKMVICIAVVAIYVVSMRTSFSRMSVFASMFLYLLYLVVEVMLATKLHRQKNA